jgi:hypothetical protein
LHVLNEPIYEVPESLSGVAERLFLLAFNAVSLGGVTEILMAP